MGKTPKPLRFLVHPDIADWPEWAGLASQGHTIRTDWPDVDRQHLPQRRPRLDEGGEEFFSVT